MSGTQATRRWRFLYTPKWLGWHLLVVASVIGMLWLGDWQLRRAEAGNPLSWAYTFEWPLFAIFAVFFWIKTIRDEAHPGDEAAPADVSLPAGTRPAPVGAASRDAEEAGEADPELAAYNAYLARLSKEVKGHGRWHGLR
jgi:DNA-binding transcriptional regulator of glucitol operon